jgi:hypothetical protein
MPEESNYEAVNVFRRIKEDTKCDDLTAAILTLAEHLRYVEVGVAFSENGYPERIGQDIADAIGGVTKDGAIQVKMAGERKTKPASGAKTKLRLKNK